MSGSGREGRVSGRRRRGAVFWCGLLLALSACGGGEDVAGTATHPSATESSPAKSGSQAEAGGVASGASGKAAGVRTRFTDALREVLAEDTGPSREQIASALIAAGFDRSAVEVSIDTTPTGLEVAAMEAAVRVDGQCLIGQLRGGNLSVTTLPVLASGHCFVGDQR